MNWTPVYSSGYSPAAAADPYFNSAAPFEFPDPSTVIRLTKNTVEPCRETLMQLIDEERVREIRPKLEDMLLSPSEDLSYELAQTIYLSFSTDRLACLLYHLSDHPFVDVLIEAHYICVEPHLLESSTLSLIQELSEQKSLYYESAPKAVVTLINHPFYHQRVADYIATHLPDQKYRVQHMLFPLLPQSLCSDLVEEGDVNCLCTWLNALIDHNRDYDSRASAFKAFMLGIKSTNTIKRIVISLLDYYPETFSGGYFITELYLSKFKGVLDLSARRRTQFFAQIDYQTRGEAEKAFQIFAKFTNRSRKLFEEARYEISERAPAAIEAAAAAAEEDEEDEDIETDEFFYFDEIELIDPLTENQTVRAFQQTISLALEYQVGEFGLLASFKHRIENFPACLFALLATHEEEFDWIVKTVPYMSEKALRLTVWALSDNRALTLLNIMCEQNNPAVVQTILSSLSLAAIKEALNQRNQKMRDELAIARTASINCQDCLSTMPTTADFLVLSEQSDLVMQSLRRLDAPLTRILEHFYQSEPFNEALSSRRSTFNKLLKEIKGLYNCWMGTNTPMKQIAALAPLEEPEPHTLNLSNAYLNRLTMRVVRDVGLTHAGELTLYGIETDEDFELIGITATSTTFESDLAYYLEDKEDLREIWNGLHQHNIYTHTQLKNNPI